MKDTEKASPDQRIDSTRNLIRNRAIIVGLFAVFLLPVLAAVVLQSRWVDWQPPAVKQSGTLLNPVVALPAALRAELAAGPGQWALIHHEPAGCTVACRERLGLVLHLHELLGREQDKLHRALHAPGATAESTRAEFPALQVLDSSGDWLGAQTEAGGLLLVDPLGNAMMHYSADFDPVGLRGDLSRLLKKSKFLSEDRR